METMKVVMGFIIVGVGVVVVFAVLLTIPIWLLWNWLMPTIFGVAKVTLLQALGLNILSAILFKTSYKK